MTPHSCDVCRTPLRAPGKDSDRPRLRPGVTRCDRCGSTYRWEHWRMNRYPDDVGSIYEPRLVRRGKEVVT